ncbi:MAG TPA: hypothetical protein VJ917_01400 [Saprospiraceae bacterium]|nr:hypothetical protein [Saprospiraceae bacterium]
MLHLLFAISLLLAGTATWAQDPDSDQDAKAIQGMLGDILSQGNKANEAELPSTYDFDYKLTMEFWEEGKDRQSMTMMWSKDRNITGMLTEDDLMVFDNNQDIIVQFDQKKMEANILPNIMKGMGQYLKPEMEEEMEILSVQKTGNKKEILGYTCEEILVETEDDKSQAWVTYDLNTSMQDVLGNSMDIQIENYIDEKFADEFKDAMAMYTEATDKKNGEVQYSEVIEIVEGYQIDNSKYKVQR